MPNGSTPGQEGHNDCANLSTAAGHGSTAGGAANGMSQLATRGCQPPVVDSRRAAVIRARYRVTLTGGEVVTLQSPTMRSDSIIGVLGGAVVAVASSDVGWVEVRRFSIWKTIGLVYASSAVASAMGLLAPRSECVGFLC